MKEIEQLKLFANSIRNTILEAAHNAGNQGVHIGGALSYVDILAVIYGSYMHYDVNNPTNPNRDRFILSKGHDCLALYAVLNKVGYISDDELKNNYLQDGGFLPTHPVKNIEKGIECSSGSLGMGLAFGIGQAIAAKKDNRSSHIYIQVGDGECDEGSCWEAFIAAMQYKLDNITLFIDKNGFQSDGATKDIMPINFFDALNALGWYVQEIDGHDIKSIYDAVGKALSVNDKPSVIIANTIKGKGISFMENNNAWHHGHLNEDLYNQAKQELNNGN